MINTVICGNRIKSMVNDTTDLIQKLEILTDELLVNKQTKKEVELEFDQIFTHSNLSTVLVRADGQFIKANPKLALFTGYQLNELKFLSYQDITHKDDLYIDMELAHKVKEGKLKSYAMIKRYIRKDGSTVWGLLLVAKIPDQKDNLKYYLAQIVELTPFLSLVDTASIEKARKEGDTNIGIFRRQR